MTELAQLPEFRAAPRMTEQLLAAGITKTFDEGETILREHAYIRSIPIVLDGVIKVIRTDEDGREILLYYIEPGESCIMSFLGGIHRDTSKVKAVAQERCEVLFVPIENVTTLVRDNPQWLDYIFRLYHKRFEELLDVVNAVAFQHMDERIEHFLHKKAEVTGARTLALTHEQLANELGTARVVVSRLLKQFEDQGRIRLGRNKIELL